MIARDRAVISIIIRFMVSPFFWISVVLSSSHFRGETEHDVEASGDFADARSFERSKFHRHGLPLLEVLDTFPNAVFFIAGMTLDVALGGQQFFAALFDLVVNVRRAARIRHRLDGAEQIFACRSGDEAPKTLEILVAFLAIAG